MLGVLVTGGSVAAFVPRRTAITPLVEPGGAGLVGNTHFASGCNPSRSAKATTKMAIPLRSMENGSDAEQFRNRIGAGSTPWVAPAQAAESQVRTANRPMAPEGIQGVLGAGGGKTATRSAEQCCFGRRDGPAVELDHRHKDELERLHGFRLRSTPPVAAPG